MLINDSESWDQHQVEGIEGPTANQVRWGANVPSKQLRYSDHIRQRPMDRLILDRRRTSSPLMDLHLLHPHRTADAGRRIGLLLIAPTMPGVTGQKPDKAFP